MLSESVSAATIAAGDIAIEPTSATIAKKGIRYQERRGVVDMEIL